MNPTILESFKTGTKKVTVELVSWQDDDFGVRITDGSTNFTSFHVDSENDGQMRGRFIAEAFQKAIKAARVSAKKPRKARARAKKSRIDKRRCVHGHKMGTPAGDMHRGCARKGTV